MTENSKPTGATSKMTHWILEIDEPGYPNLIGEPADILRELISRMGLVPPHNACPKCGERLMDALVLDSDSNTVTCLICGHIYTLA